MSDYEYAEGYERGRKAGYVAALRDLLAVGRDGRDVAEAAAKTLQEITGE